ncbi:hypothetical protein A9Z06_01205 [Rhizobium sp. YK2]|nr:hypothetical protein A9Z06_01205 [Rhizobium sp. YK2]
MMAFMINGEIGRGKYGIFDQFSPEVLQQQRGVRRTYTEASRSDVKLNRLRMRKRGHLAPYAPGYASGKGKCRGFTSATNAMMNHEKPDRL